MYMPAAAAGIDKSTGKHSMDFIITQHFTEAHSAPGRVLIDLANF
jgi:hypothetical protein